MATTTVPEVQPKTAAPVLTPSAIAKVKEIMASQAPVPSGLRLSVVGGGCSGFQYSMAFENGAGMMDKVFDFDGLKVYVDATSLMYLGGAHVDYVETLEGAGFKFEANISDFTSSPAFDAGLFCRSECCRKCGTTVQVASVPDLGLAGTVPECFAVGWRSATFPAAAAPVVPGYCPSSPRNH